MGDSSRNQRDKHTPQRALAPTDCSRGGNPSSMANFDMTSSELPNSFNIASDLPLNPPQTDSSHNFIPLTYESLPIFHEANSFILPGFTPPPDDVQATLPPLTLNPLEDIPYSTQQSLSNTQSDPYDNSFSDQRLNVPYSTSNSTATLEQRPPTGDHSNTGTEFVCPFDGCHAQTGTTYETKSQLIRHILGYESTTRYITPHIVAELACHNCGKNFYYYYSARDHFRGTRTKCAREVGPEYLEADPDARVNSTAKRFKHGKWRWVQPGAEKLTRLSHLPYYAVILNHYRLEPYTIGG